LRRIARLLALAMRGVLTLGILALCVWLLRIGRWLELAGRLLRCPGLLARIWLLRCLAAAHGLRICGLAGSRTWCGPGWGGVGLRGVDSRLRLRHCELRRVHARLRLRAVGGYAFSRLSG
jgi:hypothetical protein